MTHTRRITFLLSAATTLAIQSAHAQSSVDPHRREATTQAVSPAGDNDIIVTATKREQRLIDVPIAITALSGAALERINADRFNDYVRTVPGLVYNQGGANSGSFAIRGISTSSQSLTQKLT